MQVQWEDLSGKEKLKKAGQFAAFIMFLNSPLVLKAYEIHQKNMEELGTKNASLQLEVFELRERVSLLEASTAALDTDMDEIKQGIITIQGDIKLLLQQGAK